MTQKIVVKTYCDLTNEEILSWVSNCNKAFRFDKATFILQKYASKKDNFFCLLIDNSEVIASYSGFSCVTSGFRAFLSTDTFSLSRHSTSILGSYLYDHLRSLDYDFVFGWPNERIKNIRAKYLHWNYLGHKQLYVAYPKVGFTVNTEIERGPFSRKRGGFFSRNPICGMRTIDNLCNPSVMNYSRINIALGSKNPCFYHVPIPGQRKLFGFCVLQAGRADRIQAPVKNLFNNADLSWIDVP